MANLIEALQGFITPHLISKTSSHLEESEAGITNTFNASLPTVLAGLEDQTSQPDKWNAAYNMIRHDGGSILLDMDNTVPGGPGSHMPAGNKFLSEIFGSNLSTVRTGISNYAGVKVSSATAVLEYVSPLVLGFLGRMTKEENLDAAGLSSFLVSQKASIRSAVPAGLVAAPDLGDADQTEPLPPETPAPAVTAATAPAPDGRPAPPPPAKKTNWLWPVLLALAVVLLIFGLRNCNDNEAEQTTTGADTAASSATAAVTLYRSLPAGRVLPVPGPGPEGKQLVYS